MKKLISLFLIIAMLLPANALMSVSVYAVDTPEISVIDTSGFAGEVVNVNINIANNPGVTALSFNVEYDTSRLALAGVTDGAILGSATASFGNDLTANPYKLFWDDVLSTNNTGNGTVATLQFHILDTAEAGSAAITLSLNQASTFNVDLDDVAFTMTSGSVNV